MNYENQKNHYTVAVCASVNFTVNVSAESYEQAESSVLNNYAAYMIDDENLQVYSPQILEIVEE